MMITKSNQLNRMQTLIGGATGPKKSIDSLLADTPVRTSEINRDLTLEGIK